MTTARERRRVLAAALKREGWTADEELDVVEALIHEVAHSAIVSKAQMYKPKNVDQTDSFVKRKNPEASDNEEVMTIAVTILVGRHLRLPAIEKQAWENALVAFRSDGRAFQKYQNFADIERTSRTQKAERLANRLLKYLDEVVQKHKEVL